MLSSFLVLDSIHLINTQWSVILPAVFSTFPVFLMYRFFRSIPEAILESAKLDTGSAFQIFLNIGLPFGFCWDRICAGTRIFRKLESD